MGNCNIFTLRDLASEFWYNRTAAPQYITKSDSYDLSFLCISILCDLFRALILC